MAVFAHGQLRLYLLALLEQGAKHGYELITALSERFAGAYRPSAGTVYPRLARLEAEGLVERVDDGRKGTYALTDKGRAELNERRGELELLESDLDRTVRELADQVRREVSGTMATLRADLAAAADEARKAAAGRASANHGRPDGRGGQAGRWAADSSASAPTAAGATAGGAPGGVLWPQGILSEWRDLDAIISAAVTGGDRRAYDVVRRALRKARTDIDHRLR